MLNHSQVRMRLKTYFFLICDEAVIFQQGSAVNLLDKHLYLFLDRSASYLQPRLLLTTRVSGATLNMEVRASPSGCGGWRSSEDAPTLNIISVTGYFASYNRLILTGPLALEPLISHELPRAVEEVL